MTITDRFRCPIQTTAAFSFETYRHCKYFQLDKGQHMTVRCRKNRDKADRQAFESAYLLDWLGMEWRVEIEP